MTTISVRNSCADFNSYRSARVKSLFNVESGANFSIDADIPSPDEDWRIGVVVGPSGSGKTSIGRRVFPGVGISEHAWGDGPIVDQIAPDGSFDDVTAALSAVGLGNVPSWLRPYAALSNGERFRADLARVIAEAPPLVVIDEFTSVVDRQIAKFGALAFSKARRRVEGKCVLLTCHYDVLEWIEPDWVFDTRENRLDRGLLRRPKFDLKIHETDWSLWPYFEIHHYLKMPRMVGAKCYVGTVDGEPVCHVAVGTQVLGKRYETRACRLVVMPEWQGAGIGVRFLDAVAQIQLDGDGRTSRKTTTTFHTSHPGLASALRRNKKWVQISAKLYGANGAKSAESLARSSVLRGTIATNTGYGGHFRAVQGFRYMGAT